MGILKKVGTIKQAKKTFGKLIAEEVDAKRAADELARRRQQRGGSKR